MSGWVGVESVVFDHDRIYRSVENLLAGTSLGEHLIHIEHLGGPANMVHEYIPGALPPAAWSSGEQALWAFLASVSGRGTVNLHRLAAAFTGIGEAEHIVDVVRALLVDGRDW